MKKQFYWFFVLIAFLMLLGFGILLHHFLVSGRWFDPEDFLHHEVFFVLVYGTLAGLIIAVIPVIGMKRR